MESRKAWRNRDPSAGEGVLALLEALRSGLGAENIGLFDDDRADPEADGRAVALNFWDSFGERPCAALDWDAWYQALRAANRVDITCRCGGAHRLCGFLIHERWVLLLVAPSVVPAEGAAVVVSCLRALAAKLPPAMTPDERRQVSLAPTDDDQDALASAPAATPAGPVWWVRKRPA